MLAVGSLAIHEPSSPARVAHDANLPISKAYPKTRRHEITQIARIAFIFFFLPSFPKLMVTIEIKVDLYGLRTVRACAQKWVGLEGGVLVRCDSGVGLLLRLVLT